MTHLLNLFIYLTVYFTSLYSVCCQAVKPNKEQTISYLNEKLSLYNTEDFLEFTASASNSGASFRRDLKNFYYNYKVFNEDNRCYISFFGVNASHIELTNRQPVESKDIAFYKIPIDQINSILIKNDTTYSKTVPSNDLIVQQYYNYKNKYLYVKLKSASAVSRSIDDKDAKPEYSKEFQIVFRDGESNIHSKIKRAILNLKLVCPEPKSNDPFEK